MSSKVKLQSHGRSLRILVVDEGFIGSLHTAIALADLECEVLLAGAVGGAAEYEGGAFRSVACPLPTHQDFIPFMRALASEFDADVVYPATEPTLLTLSADAVLGGLVFPPLSVFQRQCIIDKQIMLAAAAAAGVLVPLTQSGVPNAYPAIVKANAGRGGDAVFLVADQAAAERAAARIRSAGREPVAQQLIDGPTYLVGGVFDRGKAVRLYAGQKLKQQPARTGPASVIRSVYEPALIEAACTVFGALQWHGLASCDFVRDPAGRFYFLEVNPRPWGSIAAAADAGVDLFGPLKVLMAGGSPVADLRFSADVTTEIFPLYLLDWQYRLDPRTLLRIHRDLGRHPLWRDVRFLRHTLYRLQRVRDNWPQL
jgi:glutathione synthase/RimK-type ligase-like ATP-grasp enzyme